MRRRRLIVFGLAVPLVTALAAALVAAGLALARPQPDGPETLAIAPFALVDPAGRVVTERPASGLWRLVLFGRAGCTDACMEALIELGAGLDALGPDVGRVEALFVTIDPGHDTAADLATFTATFDSRILPLTGSAAQVAQALRAFHLAVEHTAEGGDPHTTAAVFTIDPAGRLVRLFAPGTPGGLIAQGVHDLLQAPAPPPS